MDTFTVYPAIDLHLGQVVRLVQGDLGRQTIFSDDPGQMARRWLEAGARWLHVVNLDGAFEQQGRGNQTALQSILEVAKEYEANVQFGGGLRTLEGIEKALSAGVTRAILGTVAVENPEIVGEAILRFGTERIAAGIDATDGQVKVSGWTRPGGVEAVELATQLSRLGLRSVIYTNISRDGTGSGVDVASTRTLAESTKLDVIASGGVRTLEDVRKVKAAGLSGIIIGRALYDGAIALEEALTC